MSTKDKIEFTGKTDFKIEKKVTFLGIIIPNMNFILFQNNCMKIWNEIKKDLLRWKNYNCHCLIEFL